MLVARGPQIERFLSESQNFMSGVEFKPEIMSELESSQEEASCLFTRPQKLISLCRWEPRWLLNVQDCEEHSAQSKRNGYSFGPSKTHAPSYSRSRAKSSFYY